MSGCEVRRHSGVKTGFQLLLILKKTEKLKNTKNTGAVKYFSKGLEQKHGAPCWAAPAKQDGDAAPDNSVRPRRRRRHIRVKEFAKIPLMLTLLLMLLLHGHTSSAGKKRTKN